MIGVFDSGLGGLTVLRALVRRFPDLSFTYLGDHANVPYGNRPSDEILALTEAGVARLMAAECRLVLLGCNTATAVAARRLQQVWLPTTPWHGRCNVLGIVAPTVEAATHTPWAVATPQYPQKYITETIAVFGTRRTVASGVYPEEIRKRCPRVEVVQQVCAELAGAIEAAAPTAEIERLVADAVAAALASTGGRAPHRAILGCTHFPLVEDVFRRHLPPATRVLSQPDVVADSLEDYLARHPRYVEGASPPPRVALWTTGDPARVGAAAAVFWPDGPPFQPARRV
jgi:glutamate racemase